MVLNSRSFLVLVAACCLSSARAGAAERPEVKTFASNGVKIAYFEQGAGEPVVLIHGWLSSGGINWALPGISAQLARDFRVIALDVRGHGHSDKPNDEDKYGTELVDDVVRLLDHLKIEKAHVVGYSMGGIIAGNFLAKHPDRVLSGTICGMGWLKTGGLGQRGFEQIGKNDPNARALAICGRSLAKLALTEDEIKSIEKPVAVMVGDDDKLIHRLYVEPLQRTRPDWPVVSIDKANHISCIMKPQFRDELASWLKKQKAPNPAR
jgi:pimeloyl-ACP methyl ester carboxylesterase